MIDILLDFWRSLRREPSRTFLTLLGIVLGSGSLVFLGSALAAASFAFARIAQDASGDDISRIDEAPSRTREEGRTARPLNQRDVEALASHSAAQVGEIVGIGFLARQEASQGNQRLKVGITSNGGAYARIAGMKLLHGHWLSEVDEGERRCMVGYEVFMQLLGGEWPLKESAVVINGSTMCRVIGVFESRPALFGGDPTWSQDRQLFIPHSTFTRVISSTPKYDQIVIRHTLINNQLPDLTRIAKQLTPYVQSLHNGVHNFEFAALNQDEKVWELIIYSIGAILFACALVAMTVGGVNVMNAQLVNVFEKTKEYGIRRALGASAAHLRTRVLIESSLFALIGCTIGVISGLCGAWALSALLTRFLTPWPFQIVPWSLMLAIASCSAVGVVSGLIPALRAGKLQPTECLRSN